MAFGIEIINNNDRIIIDNNYSNFGYFSLNSSTAARDSAYPGVANTVASDFIVARPNTSANGILGRSSQFGLAPKWGPPSVQGGVPSAIFYVLRNNTRFIPAQLSGYGVEVYANTGNVVFTSNVTKNFEVVAVGNFNSKTANVTNIAFPSSTTWYSNFTDYYVVINNTISYYLAPVPPQDNFPGIPGIDFVVGYTYRWANSTHGRILITSYSGGIPIDFDFHYMILKEVK